VHTATPHECSGVYRFAQDCYFNCGLRRVWLSVRVLGSSRPAAVAMSPPEVSDQPKADHAIVLNDLQTWPQHVWRRRRTNPAFVSYAVVGPDSERPAIRSSDGGGQATPEGGWRDLQGTRRTALFSASIFLPRRDYDDESAQNIANFARSRRI
jgi:hypothetical protein